MTEKLSESMLLLAQFVIDVKKMKPPAGGDLLRVEVEPFLLEINRGREAKYSMVEGAETHAIPPFNVLLWERGWPVGLMDSFGGTVVEGIEDRLIVSLEREITNAGLVPCNRDGQL